MRSLGDHREPHHGVSQPFIRGRADSRRGGYPRVDRPGGPRAIFDVKIQENTFDGSVQAIITEESGNNAPPVTASLIIGDNPPSRVLYRLDPARLSQTPASAWVESLNTARWIREIYPRMSQSELYEWSSEADRELYAIHNTVAGRMSQNGYGRGSVEEVFDDSEPESFGSRSDHASRSNQTSRHGSSRQRRSPGSGNPSRQGRSRRSREDGQNPKDLGEFF
ncbi:uncharacterized protein I303_107320 [Kwoniella dejecticola CBS 10117]|uniref:Uncharacterized protein n=1 Tax=Kwoniella dejecticola CBS 10117 TaxID=1296121 RepID=A0A1A5ZZC0_9TREE|nr:uncharacterized protein I303_06723 [Kwoniella dejecticola CBS 10117]OBR83164.1 hypothetical protein I303_06723 [Kwoniella dejecticola CBS 10117]